MTSSVTWHFEHGNATKTCNRIMYPILAHIYAMKWQSCEYYMWQSQIEIKYYSIAYFEHITEFDAL